MSDADREELETLLTERDALRAEVERLRRERDALRAEVERLRRERDALSDEVERLRRERVPMCVPTAEGFRRVGGRRLLAACQSLHRAWKREREEVERLRLDVGRLLVAYGSRDEFDGVDDAIEDAAEMRAENNRLRAFVAALRSDGLDIDDPDTAPHWTGKIHAPDGRLLFDLATVAEPEPPSESTPPICTWCGLPVETGKVMRVTRTDAAGVAHTFHWACWSMHAEQANRLAKGTP